MALVWYFLIGIAAWAVADPVIGLTNENFDGLVNQGLWFIKFYAPWCGHCKKLAPDFVEVASQFGPALKFGEVDCTVETDLCAKERFDVSRFPQMMFFRDGLPRPYNLGRSVTEMLSFGQRVIAPAVSKGRLFCHLDGTMFVYNISDVYRNFRFT
jgi:thiol-disulfide isomerase/thioredoxin